MAQSVKKIADPALIPQIWRVSAKDHDRAATTAIVYLEHDSWDMVFADVVLLGGLSRLPPPGTDVIVTWGPSRLGGFRPTAITTEAERTAALRAASEASAATLSLERWLAAVQELGLAPEYTAERAAALLGAIDRYHDSDADEVWDASTGVDGSIGADILWALFPQRHGIDREDAEHPFHGVPDDPEWPRMVLANHDWGYWMDPLVQLVGPAANIPPVDRELETGLETYVARVRQALTTAGVREVPYLADGSNQSQQYLLLLAPDLARKLRARALLAIYL